MILIVYVSSSIYCFHLKWVSNKLLKTFYFIDCERWLMIEIYFFWHFISTGSIFHRFSIFYLEIKTNCAWQNKRIGYGTFMLTRSVCFAASSEFFMIVYVYLNGFCIVIPYNQIKLHPPLISKMKIENGYQCNLGCMSMYFELLLN